jgi:hypothetical protein
MYMSVRQYEKVSNTQDLGRQFRENFEPLISAIPGFLAYYFADAGSGTVFSTSIFETKANAEESNRVAAEWVGKHPNVLPTATRVTTGEVIGRKVAEELVGHKIK